MPGIRLATTAAREGCLAHLDTLAVLSTAQRARLRQQLLCQCPHAVAARMWAGYHAARVRTDPATVREMELFGRRIAAVCDALTELATNPGHFRAHYLAPAAAAAPALAMAA